MDIKVNWEYCFFVASSTILLYSLHRIVGIQRVGSYEDKGRFAIIKKYKSHIILYASLSAISAIILFFRLPIDIKLQVLVPSILSAFYILPAFSQGRRLRDIPFIKIIMIAICWAWLTAYIPLKDNGLSDFENWYTVSRLMFILAITIPFDIRDMEVDKVTGVHTIVHYLGITRSKIAGLFFLTLGLLIIDLNGQFLLQSIRLIDIVVFTVAAILVLGSNEKRTDYYYSFAVDGTMGLFYILFALHAFL